MFKKTMICVLCISLLGFTACTPKAAQNSNGSSVTSGSSSIATPQNVSVLSQSVTDSSFTLVWNAPEERTDISDYKVTVTNGSNSQSYLASSNQSSAASYIQQFYTQGTGDLYDNETKVQDAYKISMHSFCLNGLTAATTYSITVQSQDADGNLSDVASLTQSTTPVWKVLSIEDFGAIGDGKLADDTTGTASLGTLNTAAIQSAINACQNGDTLLIPSGKIFVTGPLTLHSNMTLDVEGTLLGTDDASKYANPADSDNSKKGQKSASLIAADTGNYENIRIVGKGCINGNGWTQVSQKDTSVAFGDTFSQYQGGKAENVQSTAKNHLAAAQCTRFADQGTTNTYATRSNLLSFSNVNGLYLGDGLTLENPSMHTISTSQSSNIVLNNLTVSTYDCNNGDGIDYSGSEGGLTVVGSVFNTGDDCIAFSASSSTTGNAWVFDNYFGRGHGVIALGSNTQKGIENVVAEDNVINGTAVGMRGKSKSGNGGGAWNITFRNSALANMTDNDGSPFLLTNGYSASTSGTLENGQPCFHDISVSNCTVNGAKNAFISYQGSPTDTSGSSGTDYNLSISNVSFAVNSTMLKGSSSKNNQSTLSYLKDCTFDNLKFYGLETPWSAASDSTSTLTNISYTNGTP